MKEFTFKYAYHWQDKEGQLRSRWDNAPHWPDIPTHPHHKHIMSGDKVFVEASKGGDPEEYTGAPDPTDPNSAYGEGKLGTEPRQVTMIK